jgi:phosphoribosyl-ATP pyrophosphohydrolase/phosphoribosyl-AMP cyclohydrolase
MSRAALRRLDPSAVRFGPDGLVVAVVQDADDGRVLMVAWLDAEALAATQRTGEAHFHSRSRGVLWRKGETSGHTLAVVDLALDCDGDSVLIRARPAGPTCHTGAATCFHQVTGGLSESIEATVASGVTEAPQGFAWLETLWATIEQRTLTRPAGSYTSRLLDGGVDAVARKVAEEAVEVLMAAKDDAVAQGSGAPRPRAELAGEMADLLYHALVLLAERGLPPDEVIAALRSRHSG